MVAAIRYRVVCNGVGSSVVNALSTKMIAEVVKDGQLYSIEFATGASGTAQKVGPTDRPQVLALRFIPTQLSLKRRLT